MSETVHVPRLLTKESLKQKDTKLSESVYFSAEGMCQIDLGCFFWMPSSSPWSFRSFGGLSCQGPCEWACEGQLVSTVGFAMENPWFTELRMSNIYGILDGNSLFLSRFYQAKACPEIIEDKCILLVLEAISIWMFGFCGILRLHLIHDGGSMKDTLSWI